jgi:hypothetical protein
MSDEFTGTAAAVISSLGACSNREMRSSSCREESMKFFTNERTPARTLKAVVRMPGMVERTPGAQC